MVDPARLEQTSTELLQQLIRFNTVNPPGNEAAAQTFIQSLLEEHGFLVAAIRPPTVAPGTSRLRVALSAAHTEDQVDALSGALALLTFALVTLPAGGLLTVIGSNVAAASATLNVGVTISGVVFEDANYGGGAGRSLAASGGVGQAGERVRL